MPRFYDWTIRDDGRTFERHAISNRTAESAVGQGMSLFMAADASKLDRPLTYAPHLSPTELEKGITKDLIKSLIGA
jgi:hypothetical protein